MTTTPLPEGYVTYLPNAAPQRHSYAREVYVPAHKTLTRLPQTERTCTLCGVVKVTVHEDGGGARREWRQSEAGEQGAGEIFCAGMVGVKA